MPCEWNVMHVDTFERSKSKVVRENTKPFQVVFDVAINSIEESLAHSTDLLWIISNNRTLLILPSSDGPIRLVSKPSKVTTDWSTI